MYGENYGTSTLARKLKNIAADIYFNMDDGISLTKLVNDSKTLMEGSIVLWERMVDEMLPVKKEDE